MNGRDAFNAGGRDAHAHGEKGLRGLFVENCATLRQFVLSVVAGALALVAFALLISPRAEVRIAPPGGVYAQF
jgi:hypothetical protein